VRFSFMSAEPVPFSFGGARLVYHREEALTDTNGVRIESERSIFVQ